MKEVFIAIFPSQEITFDRNGAAKGAGHNEKGSEEEAGEDSITTIDIEEAHLHHNDVHSDEGGNDGDDDVNDNGDGDSDDVESGSAFGGKIKRKFKSMTSEEIAMWIDNRAKIVFPGCFIVFNVFYWIFATRSDCTIFGTCDEWYYQDLT